MNLVVIGHIQDHVWSFSWNILGPLHFNMTLNNVMNPKTCLMKGVLNEELRPSKYGANSHKILSRFKEYMNLWHAPRRQLVVHFLGPTQRLSLGYV